MQFLDTKYLDGNGWLIIQKTLEGATETCVVLGVLGFQLISEKMLIIQPWLHQL